MRTFVVVSGLPGSGKTTMAAALAEYLKFEHLDKDRFLEAHFLERDKMTPALRNELSRRADDELKSQALLLRSAVLSSWWRHPKSVRTSGTPVHWLQDDAIRLLEVFCKCPAEVAVNRFKSRQRHPGHLDAKRSREELLDQLVEAEALGPLFPERALVCSTAAPLSPSAFSQLAGQIGALASATYEA